MDLWWEAQEPTLAPLVACMTSKPSLRSPNSNIETSSPTHGIRRQRPRLPVRSCAGPPGQDERDAGRPATPLRRPRTPTLIALLDEWGSRTHSSSPGQKLARPLEGLRIADFTWVLAGPFCTRMLGDLGADVIRVQNEERSTFVKPSPTIRTTACGIARSEA